MENPVMMLVKEYSCSSSIVASAVFLFFSTWDLCCIRCDAVISNHKAAAIH